MKKVFLALTLAVGAIFVTGCSSDDNSDDGPLEVPAYKSSSALYQITQTGSPLSSVEFTESGSYVIVRNGQRQNAPQGNGASRADEAVKESPTLLVFSPWNQPETRSTTYSNIITGKYTKTDDMTYVLEGFGTIKVNMSGDNTYSLVITETGSSPYTLAAAKKEQYSGSEPTDKLCRTWRIASMRMEVSMSGKYEGFSFNFKVDEKVDGGDMAGLMLKCYESEIRQMAKAAGYSASEREVKEAVAELKSDIEKTYLYIENVIFTQAGTYMVTYRGDRLAISTWTWTGDDFKKIRYSWDYSNMNGVLSNECSVGFDGKKCYIVEMYDDLSNEHLLGSDFGSSDGKLTYTLEAE